MSLLTVNAQDALKDINIEPKILVQFDGVDTIYGATSIREVVRIGDDITIGEFTIGGYKDITDQDTVISFKDTTTKIINKLDPDKGTATSVSSMKVRFIDDGSITELITPSVVVDDIIFRRCKVWIGFGDSTSFPEDYIVLFRGFVNGVGAGPSYVDFDISSVYQQMRQTLFNKQDATLTSAITDVQTSIAISDVAFLINVPIDPSTAARSTYLKTYVIIEDEIVEYTGIAGLTLTGCVRASLGTTAVAHDINKDLSSFYQLEDTAMDMALRLMLSDPDQSDYLDLATRAVGIITPTNIVANSFIFTDDVVHLHNVRIGDFIKSSGFTDGGNNIASYTEILNIQTLDDGSYVTVDATLTDNGDDAGTVSFLSKYNVLGEGLKMINDQVDIERHELLKLRFLSSAQYRFTFRDTLDEAKNFIGEQIYLPYACYEVPRFARSSVNYTIGPIPTDRITTLDKTNIKNPSSIRMRRSLGKNFYNTILYNFEEQLLDDKLTRSVVEISEDSHNRIPNAGNRALVIDSIGIRDDLSGENQARIAGGRLLDRYQFGAEYISGLKITFSVSMGIDIGDILLLDSTDLKIANTTDGDREKPISYFECINKDINIRTGEVSVELTDINFSTQNRYGLVTPASKVKVGLSGTKFIIKPSFNTTTYGINEFRKWDRYVTFSSQVKVKVRNADFSVIAESEIQSIAGNEITLKDDLGFTPTVDMIMELSNYNGQSDQVKLIYVHMTDNAAFDDGKDQYKML